jgi:hypothetical protein
VHEKKQNSIEQREILICPFALTRLWRVGAKRPKKSRKINAIRPKGNEHAR